MDVTSLEASVQQYLNAGLAPEETRKTYRAGINNFIQFSSKYDFSPVPTTQATLCSYVAYLADKKSAYKTITTYLVAVRYLQIINNVSPAPLSSMFTLQLVMKGTRRSIINKEKPRLPITPAILYDIRDLWSRRPHDFDIIMLWAACCMAFAGFFRLGEITVPSASGYDPQQHLSFGDVSVDSRLAPQLLCVHLRRSKTDQFGRGADIYLGRTDDELCPVAAVLAYLAVRGDGAGPLFRRTDGLPLTTSWFISEVRGALAMRFGAATAAAAAGIEDSTIQALGRWSSAASCPTFGSLRST